LYSISLFHSYIYIINYLFQIEATLHGQYVDVFLLGVAFGNCLFFNSLAIKYLIGHLADSLTEVDITSLFNFFISSNDIFAIALAQALVLSKKFHKLRKSFIHVYTTDGTLLFLDLSAVLMSNEFQKLFHISGLVLVLELTSSFCSSGLVLSHKFHLLESTHFLAAPNSGLFKFVQLVEANCDALYNILIASAKLHC